MGLDVSGVFLIVIISLKLLCGYCKARAGSDVINAANMTTVESFGKWQQR